MTSYVTSPDGTQIAFDRLGQGPPVVVVSGMFCDRQTTQRLAEQLAWQFSVINYDRLGRGESGDTEALIRPERGLPAGLSGSPVPWYRRPPALTDRP